MHTIFWRCRPILYTLMRSGQFGIVHILLVISIVMLVLPALRFFLVLFMLSYALAIYLSLVAFVLVSV